MLLSPKLPTGASRQGRPVGPLVPRTVSELCSAVIPARVSSATACWVLSHVADLGMDSGKPRISALAVLQAELCPPPNSYVEVLTPGVSECNRI